ncbi:fatty acid desaturase [Luteibacter sp. Sphag1AF]|uniref:fatty acid desaturase family protein n=1 Tax=Luteibacter sp. Sphag1AF TaxID=2587031 RepID=UPI001621FBA4|nr:fatty acid desaturase [Luteibacter sp. Sphag1AF]MBB3228876.1 fatty acid desaturase [Luteibacter sp. Sphag1AF]
MKPTRRPPLPAEFRETSNLMGLYYIVHGLVLWLGSGWLAYAIYQHAAWPLWLRVVAMALPVISSGFGMFYMGSLGHEGFHRNMNRHQDVSMVMGMLASLGAPLFLSVGVNIYHWRHHLHTNTPQDPDLQLYRGNRNLLAKMRVSLDTNLYCVRNVVRLILARDKLDRTFPLSAARMRFYACLNVVMVAAATTGYVALALAAPTLFVFLVLAPAIVAQLYWALHPYIEHGDTADVEGNNARNCTSPVLRFMLMGYTYHLCHHLYPSVQTHRLPALYRHLKAVGYVRDEDTTETSLFGAIRIGATQVLRS